jgi:hypothetical protein
MRDMYYWYYGSLAMFQVGGDYWDQWNEAMKPALTKNQNDQRSLCLFGSWDPEGYGLNLQETPFFWLQNMERDLRISLSKGGLLMWQLILKTDNGDEEMILLEGVDSKTIGRLKENSICVHDKKLSRTHCQLDHTPDGLFLTDLDSKHGTIVNAQPVFKKEMCDGDVIEIGSTTITVSHVKEKSEKTS